MIITRDNMKSRERFYLLLSRFFAKEADEAFSDALRAMHFPKAQGLMGEGYEMLERTLAGRDENFLEELAVDYALTFLGAGSAGGKTAVPVESLYKGKGIFMADCWEEVKETYSVHGLGKSAEDMMEDHISAELEFMAYLCRKGEAAQQKEFLEKHILSWVYDFCADVEKYAKTEFYIAAAKLLLGYLEMEKALLDAVDRGEVLVSKSYSVRNERFDDILARLKECYKVYAPVKGEYRELAAFTDIAYKESVDFSDCEISAEYGKLILICPFVYAEKAYAAFGESTKVIVLARSKMGEHYSGKCAATMDVDDISAKMEIRDKDLMSYFADEVPVVIV
ncbi:MAG: molecular chaperone TorD family protein [Oscillospiraceae bacterium]|nr:molecular chaperone TorD family protein [Oscillospiraceae bacterium]